MIKVWIIREGCVAEKRTMPIDSDIDDLKEVVFGQDKKGEYRTMYNGQELVPSAIVPQNTTAVMAVQFEKMITTRTGRFLKPCQRNPFGV
jgi:hypothetical protein